jgi:hypothetical protein
MNLLGIDPGRKGGIALLEADRPATIYRVQTWPMPDTTRELHDLIAGLPLIKICALEKPFYPNVNGSRVISTIAENYGILKGALIWRDIPFQEVRPVDWKKSLNIPADKSAARQRASTFFPDDAEQWALAKHDGRAEAALLAWYCMKWR